ncbi:MAG: nucleoside phosphorylase [Anaerolineae bacterium]|nr:nucleoside phosphorylase [Anaerolineae bacterium]
MFHEPYPILEFDPNPDAVIAASLNYQPLETMPERCVLCFFKKAIDNILPQATLITHIRSEIGPNPVYRLAVNGTSIAVVHPGVGASLGGTFLEELIALGARKFIACGGAGVLNREIAMGHLIVPTSAIRDEGTSYHYLPPSREVAAGSHGVAAIIAALDAHQIPYAIGKTWTTDAPYRETPARVARRRAEGALTVEMESAAFFAIAQFRGVELAQILYGGDDVSGDVWDERDWHSAESTRERLFWLAVDAVTRIE